MRRLWRMRSFQTTIDQYRVFATRSTYIYQSLLWLSFVKIFTLGKNFKDLDIPEKILTENLVFGSNVKLGDRMTGSMQPSVSEGWFGIAPPDLTLVTRLHGSDWVYTYLRTFYEDSSKPYGVNNMVYPGAAMPNVLAFMQGQQVLSCKDVAIIASNGGVRRDEYGNDITEEKCGYLKTIEGSGKLTQQEFDDYIFNLVNFMTYVGEPSRSVRERMGWYVILFFVVFTAFLIFYIENTKKIIIRNLFIIKGNHDFIF